MHRKENLITYDFYPYKGKAYSEDIIHSILMRKSINLIRSGKAICKVNLSSGIEVKSIIKEFYSFYDRSAFVRKQKKLCILCNLPYCNIHF